MESNSTTTKTLVMAALLICKGKEEKRKRKPLEIGILYSPGSEYLFPLLGVGVVVGEEGVIEQFLWISKSESKRIC